MTMPRIAAAIAVAALAFGCASTGLEDNQANQTNTIQSTTQRVPEVGGKALSRTTTTTVTTGADGSVTETTTVDEPLVLSDSGDMTSDGPLGQSTAILGPDYWKLASESNLYVGQDWAGRNVASNSPFDIVDVDMRRPFPLAPEDVDIDGNAGIRGIYTGDVEVIDSNNDGYPDTFRSTKSSVVAAVGDLVAAYTATRQAIIEATRTTEGMRIESIERLQTERVRALRDLGASFFEAVQAVARPGVGITSEIIPGDGSGSPD